MKTNWAIWVAFAALFLLLCAITCLRCGELKKTLARGGLYLFVIALCIFILYPFYVMLITGFRSNAETTDMYHNGVVGRGHILFMPHALVDLRNRNDASPMVGQELQDRILRLRQL